MTVTISTDASFSPDLKRGSYAVWISSPVGKIQHAGVLSGRVESSNEAEIKAVANAFHILNRYIQEKLWPPIGLVYVNTDSTHAIRVINGHQTATHISEQACVDYLKGVSSSNSWTLLVRHVKGHSSGIKPRSYVNNWCDKEARKMLRSAVYQKRESDENSI